MHILYKMIGGKVMLSGEKFRKRWLVIFLMIILGASMLAGCSTEEASDGAATKADTEEAGETADQNETEESAAPSAEVIDAEELQAAIDEAEPYEGDFHVVLHTTSGENRVLKGRDILAYSGNQPGYIPVSAVGASSTLVENGYAHSAWNMLDWDMTTCWAEGNPYSEGTMEGFAYRLSSYSRIDGFRIYPGYQKSRSTYRNNIVPSALIFEAGGNSIAFDMDGYLRDLSSDDECYWIDCYFYTPMYADTINVMIAAVAAYSSDPYYDCCITEFHPFHY